MSQNFNNLQVASTSSSIIHSFIHYFLCLVRENAKKLKLFVGSLKRELFKCDPIIGFWSE